MSTTGITHSNSSCAHFTSDSDFKRSISFSRNGNRTAASRAAYSNCASDNSKFQLLRRSILSTDFIQITSRDCLQTVALFNVTGATSWLASNVSNSPPRSTPRLCLMNFASNFAL